ncbi:MAG: long-chain fatty acid--CoA ligase, partial [Treponema sp.]|nr:long-chain fatty acid--CoA ligase [Treponema sp.]
LGVVREDKMSDNVVKAEVQEIVNKINRKLLPYQRITRLTILEKPLEMTTTLKVKRNYKK